MNYAFKAMNRPALLACIRLLIPYWLLASTFDRPQAFTESHSTHEDRLSCNVSDQQIPGLPFRGS